MVFGGADFDIDGDGINNNIDNDIDNDGIVNILDDDIDGDGILNEFDDDGLIWIDGDVDKDGIVNDEDTDWDGVENFVDKDYLNPEYILFILLIVMDAYYYRIWNNIAWRIFNRCISKSNFMFC